MSEAVRRRTQKQIVQRVGRRRSPVRNRSDMAGVHFHGSHLVIIQADGAITVKPGDWVSKYSAAMYHGDTSRVHEFGCKVQKRGVTVLKPLEDPNRIRAGDTIYHLPTARSAAKRKGTHRPRIDVAAARRTADKYCRKAADTRTSVGQFLREVESMARADLAALGADALVFSLSGFMGEVIAAGGGLEVVYSPRFRWAQYFQGGLGVGAGAGVAIEAGVIWNVKTKYDYMGSFIEASFNAGKWNLSRSSTPGDAPAAFAPNQGIQDLLNLIRDGTIQDPFCLKTGWSGGTSLGGSVLYEYYFLLNPREPGFPEAQYLPPRA